MLVVAWYAKEEHFLEAITALREIRIRHPRAFMPFLSERAIETLDTPPSPTRYWILLGGIFGNFAGWALTIMLSIYWPHWVGNKPIISIPPFLIICFEMMVLCAAGAGLMGFILHNRLPRLDYYPGFDDCFALDHFGLAVECPSSRRERVREALTAGPAEFIQEHSDRSSATSLVN
jgi:hypothetical protein